MGKKRNGTEEEFRSIGLGFDFSTRLLLDLKKILSKLCV